MRHPAPVISPTLQQHLAEIFALWDDLSNFGVHESDAGLKLCLERICGWIDAQDGFWVGSIRFVKGAAGKRDAMHGWRIRAIEALHPHIHDARQNRKIVKATHEEIHPGVGAANIALAAGAGRFRNYTLQSGTLVDVAAFQQTAHYDVYYRRRDVRDRIWIIFPVNEDTESAFCFDRIATDQRFDDDDLRLAAFALRGIRWFHRQLLLSHGLGLCVEALTPAERRVIQGLLAGGTEREIADELELTRGTVHQYAMRIYRKFGVRGRNEFAALWLSGSF